MLVNNADATSDTRMGTNTFIEIDLDEVADLADLAGIQHDLESARSLAQRLQELHESEHIDIALIDALTTAILVRYSRPFSTGVRLKLGEKTLAVLDRKQRKKHDRLRAFRDKHIAHSVNAFEDNQPVARYWVERVHEEGIVSIEVNSRRVVGLSSANLEDVIDLTTAMLSYVESRVREEKARVLEIVRQMPTEDVISKTTEVSAVSDSKKIHKPRKSRRPSRRSDH